MLARVPACLRPTQRPSLQVHISHPTSQTSTSSCLNINLKGCIPQHGGHGHKSTGERLSWLLP